MKSYVVDASIVLKWLNQENEEAVKNAIEFLTGAIAGEYHLFSSDLLPHEVFNALIRGKRITGEKLKEAINNFFDFPIEIIPTSSVITVESSLIAENYNMTFYDAVYVGIAHTKQLPLVTANIRHQGKFEKINVIDIAKWSA